MNIFRRSVVGAALIAVSISGAANAQAIKNEPEQRVFTAEEIEAVPMPELAFDPGEVQAKDMEKYFYFHRENTSFDDAYADIIECDSLVSGYNYYLGTDSNTLAQSMTTYGPLAGAVGGMIGSLLADAIFGSAERRKQKRINMRNCMFYKDYDRYGLKKDLWQAFHFEEGLNRENADKREAAILQQARVASGPKPTTQELLP